MTRRLPWGTGADAVRAVKRKRTPIQRREQEKAALSDGDVESRPMPNETTSVTKSPSDARPHNRDRLRTPSTSPPPAPPPAELMHEGYDADDIFMMVEDEFQAVAQTFTHHLHHAEYVRLKKKARAASPPIFSQPASCMSEETKRKLEAKDLRERQKISIKSMIDRAGSASPDDEQEEQGNDPWHNTSLAGLMAKNNVHKRRALVGLEQIPSTTRAARGFGRREGDSQTNPTDQRRILEISVGEKGGSSSTPAVISSSIEKAEADQLDDLNAPPGTKAARKYGKPGWSDMEGGLSQKAYAGLVQPPNSLLAPSSPSDSQSENVLKVKVDSPLYRSGSKLSPSSVRKTIDSFNDFRSEDSDERTNSSERIFSSTRKPPVRHEGAKGKDSRSRLNEIPTFLV